MVTFDVSQVLYAIPILSHTTILMELYSGTCSNINLLITTGSTLVYIVVIMFIILKKFKSEKVLFS